MKRPESMLAAGVVGLCGALSVLVMVTMASCDSDAFSSGSKSSTSRDRATTTESGKPAAKPYVRAPGEPDIRVRVLTAVDSVKVESRGGLKIAKGEPKGLTCEPAVAGGWNAAERADGVVTITLRAGMWMMQRGTETARPIAGTNGAAVLIAPGVEGAGLTINGAPFPGVLRLSARSEVRDGAFDCVEFVPLEEYLCGVVAKEMLTGWPLAAYQAQAVAARSYAMQERERVITAAGAGGAGGSSFDVESSDRDQVYSGSTSNRTAIEAVRSTRGLMLMDGDNVLRAYFSSTCGGRTASAKDTWPIGRGFEYNLAAPIQARPRDSACMISPLYRWTVERPRAELAVRLKTFGERNGLMVRQLRDLAAIEVMALNDDQRPSRYKIIEPGGRWFQLSAEELRLACNTNVSGRGGMATGGAPMAAAVVPTGLSGGGGGGESGAAPAAAAPIPDIDRKTRVHSSDFDVRVMGEKVVITGRGFGHGVGLCQYCAKAMADRGEDWRTMIERFYPGAKLTKLY